MLGRLAEPDAGVARKAGHVVDRLGPGGDGLPGDDRLGGVDGDGHGRLLPERGDHGDDAAELFVGVDRRGVWSRAFAAHVDQVGPFLGQAQAVLDRRLVVVRRNAIPSYLDGQAQAVLDGRLVVVGRNAIPSYLDKLPAVGEAVGRDVDDAYHERQPTDGERLVAEPPPVAAWSPRGACSVCLSGRVAHGAKLPVARRKKCPKCALRRRVVVGAKRYSKGEAWLAPGYHGLFIMPTICWAARWIACCWAVTTDWPISGNRAEVPLTATSSGAKGIDWARRFVVIRFIGAAFRLDRMNAVTTSPSIEDSRSTTAFVNNPGEGETALPCGEGPCPGEDDSDQPLASSVLANGDASES